MAYISKVKIPGKAENYDIKAKTLSGLTTTVDELNYVGSAVDISGIAYVQDITVGSESASLVSGSAVAAGGHTHTGNVNLKGSPEIEED